MTREQPPRLSPMQQQEVEKFYLETVAVTRNMIGKRLGGDAQEIDDVTAKVYLRIMQRWPDVRHLPIHQQRLKWLSSTISRVILEEIRTRAKAPAILADDGWDQVAGALPFPESAEDALEMKRLWRQALRAAASHLQGHERQVFLNELCGLTSRETARQLRVSVATVRTHRKNALHKLEQLPAIQHVRRSLLTCPDRPSSPRGESGSHAAEERAISQLPPRQREILTWSRIGYKPSQIAEILHLSANTVRVNLHHARKRLRRTLAEQSGARTIAAGRC